jgi:hypothetical protein
MAAEAEEGLPMGQLKLSNPTNVLSFSLARVLGGNANRDEGPEADHHSSGATELPLPLTPRRLELIKAYLNDSLGRAKELTGTSIPQDSAPATQAAPRASDHPNSEMPLIKPLLALSSDLRRLAAALILVAILPNLMLAAVLWFPLVDTSGARLVQLPRMAIPKESLVVAPTETPVTPTRSESLTPVLSAPEILQAKAGEGVPLPIALDGNDGVPAGSLIVVSGLPRGSTLSSGRPHGETQWNLKPDEIGDLHLGLSNTVASEAPITIQLVTPNAGVIAETTMILKTTAVPEDIPVYRVKTQPIPGDVGQQPTLALVATDLVQKSVKLDAAKPWSGDSVPLPARRPAPTERAASENVDVNWVTPSTATNLRKAPKSSAAIIGIVSKGAKLRVFGRKRGWVEVTNTATSQRGWVYGGNVETVP